MDIYKVANESLFEANTQLAKMLTESAIKKAKIEKIIDSICKWLNDADSYRKSNGFKLTGYLDKIKELNILREELIRVYTENQILDKLIENFINVINNNYNKSLNYIKSHPVESLLIEFKDNGSIAEEIYNDSDEIKKLFNGDITIEEYEYKLNMLIWGYTTTSQVKPLVDNITSLNDILNIPRINIFD